MIIGGQCCPGCGHSKARTVVKERWLVRCAACGYKFSRERPMVMRKKMGAAAPTNKQLLILWQACAAWLTKNEVSCPETIYQTDRVQEALPELALSVGKIIGFVKVNLPSLKDEVVVDRGRGAA